MWNLDLQNKSSEKRVVENEEPAFSNYCSLKRIYERLRVREG